MSDQQLYELLGQWVSNTIDPIEKAQLIERYYAENGWTVRSTCRPCEEKDVLHYYRYQLKQKGIMSEIKKYLLPEGSTSIRMFGEGITYSFEGVETKTSKRLTNEVMDSLVKKHPELLSEGVLIPNPAYPAETADKPVEIKKPKSPVKGKAKQEPEPEPEKQPEPDLDTPQ